MVSLNDVIAFTRKNQNRAVRNLVQALENPNTPEYQIENLEKKVDCWTVLLLTLTGEKG